jgi:exopolysaccharide biosynthesis predicted pyruvyltransferase EpsI
LKVFLSRKFVEILIFVIDYPQYSRLGDSLIVPQDRTFQRWISNH